MSWQRALVESCTRLSIVEEVSFWTLLELLSLVTAKTSALDVVHSFRKHLRVLLQRFVQDLELLPGLL